VFAKLKIGISEVAKEVAALGGDESTECIMKFSLTTLNDSEGRPDEAGRVLLKPSDFPKVKLFQGLQDFYDRCDSKEDLEGLTTTGGAYNFPASAARFCF